MTNSNFPVFAMLAFAVLFFLLPTGWAAALLAVYVLIGMHMLLYRTFKHPDLYQTSREGWLSREGHLWVFIFMLLMVMGWPYLMEDS